ncbi:MAG: YiiX family permuted papain-like enzyme [Campylobacteraceae bacterium]
MKTILFLPKIFIFLFLASNILFAKNDLAILKHGDIIFQTSLSSQSKAIQIATNSPYSHCGVIFIIDDKMYVFEAVEPVKLTPIKEWIKRGKDGHFVVKRVKNADTILTKEVLEKMDKIQDEFLGKHYDLVFSWSDKEIYCSELIYKLFFNATNIEVGKLQKLRDFDLSNDIVKAKLKERYGKNIPLDETVVSPKAIFESELLEVILQN